MPSVGSSAAQTAIRRPVELQDAAAIEALAILLTDEIGSPSKHAVYVESLVGNIVAGLLDIPAERDAKAGGRLTQAQMNKLLAHIERFGDYRMTVAEMAATGRSVGKLVCQCVQAHHRQVAVAMATFQAEHLPVASIAAQLGFSDQAHLTRPLRQVAGETPAAWRKLQQA